MPRVYCKTERRTRPNPGRGRLISRSVNAGLRSGAVISGKKTVADDNQAWGERSLQGDHDAFEALVRRYQRLICELAYRMTRSPADAEAVTQERFIRAQRTGGRRHSRPRTRPIRLDAPTIPSLRAPHRRAVQRDSKNQMRTRALFAGSRQRSRHGSTTISIRGRIVNCRLERFSPESSDRTGRPPRENEF